MGPLDYERLSSEDPGVSYVNVKEAYAVSPPSSEQIAEFHRQDNWTSEFDFLDAMPVEYPAYHVNLFHPSALGHRVIAHALADRIIELRGRPTLERIATMVAKDSGVKRSAWAAGRRSDDLSRAVAAHLARRRFGYPAVAVANAMGYASGSSVSRAVQRVEHADAKVRTRIKRLERKMERLNTIH